MPESAMTQAKQNHCVINKNNSTGKIFTLPAAPKPKAAKFDDEPIMPMISRKLAQIHARRSRSKKTHWHSAGVFAIGEK